MPPPPPPCVCGTCKRCRGRVAQAKYRKTAKGKAANQRYRETARGRQMTKQINARRIYIGHDTVGYAATVGIAARIREHIKRRLRAFRHSVGGS